MGEKYLQQGNQRLARIQPKQSSEKREIEYYKEKGKKNYLKVYSEYQIWVCPT